MGELEENITEKTAFPSDLLAACRAGDALPQRAPRAKRQRTHNVEVDRIVITEPNIDVSLIKGSKVDVVNHCTARADLPAYRSAAVGSYNFEYLDHTADIQLHAWGNTLAEAFQNVALAMYNYMTPLEGIEILDDSGGRTFSVEGHDMQSLLYNFLDELLFNFATDFFVCKEIHIHEFDRERLKIKAQGRGEIFDRSRHVSGTEIKAVTYSAMQINETESDAEVFVIVDI